MQKNKRTSQFGDTELIAILEGTARETGKKFFESLVLNMAKALNTYGAWANVYNDNQSKAKSLAFYIDNEFLPDFEYDIKGTPCETVIKNDTLHHIRDNLLEVYPDDPDLKKGLLKPLSYLGIPIKDTDGKIIGNMGVLDCMPMPENPKNLAIFNLFADRATSELLRLKSENFTRTKEQKIELLLESTIDAIIELNHDMTVNMVNSSAENIFLCPSNHFIGTNFSEFLTTESFKKLNSIIDELNTLPLTKRHLWIPDGLIGLKKDSREVYVEATISEFFLENDVYYSLILRDKEDNDTDNYKVTHYHSKKINDELIKLHDLNKIIGESGPILNVLKDINKVAATDATVLIFGETGTGKELIANAVHNESRRSGKPLVKVNCAAIPANLIESEFFGHEKGAFTGASSKRNGRFLLADGGTIFLDEVGELPLELQSKLLRVLQQGEFEPVGSSETIAVDVRVIAATNRNLKEEIKKGKFREDLFYRLNVYPIVVPPLSDRGNDILLLAEKFKKNFSEKTGITVNHFSDSMKKELLSYSWPGNVRELQNVIERAVICSENGELNIETTHDKTGINTDGKDAQLKQPKDKILTMSELQEIERENIIKALESTNWKVSGEKGAAKLLGMPSTTLSSKIKALGIKRIKEK
ncbi:MAG: sigma-54-dependent Fis family transcriptional regulator [Thermodesulfobacteriota bacterium]